MTRSRTHEPAKIGDKFGPYTITALRPRGHKGRSDERVEWRCKCGRWGESYVFNLRTVKDACTHENRFGEATSYGLRCAKKRPK